MRIVAIRAAEFGPFVRGRAIEGLTGGFNVLAGPNEAGKSSLFGALQMLLQFKHSSRDQDIQACVPLTGGAPLIEAEFEIGGRRWRMRKRYLAQALAELRNLGSGEVWRGADAEIRFDRLLQDAHVKPMMGLVWVPQRQSFALPDADAALQARLKALIEAAMTGATGEDLSRAVAARVAEALKSLVTAKARKPTQDLQKAIGERDALRDALAKAQAAAANAREKGAELARARRLHAGLKSDLPDLTRRAAETDAAAQKARADRVRLTEATETEVRCRKLRDAAATERDRFVAAVAALAGLDGEEAEAHAALADAVVALDARRQSLDAATTEREAARSASRTAREILARVRRREARDAQLQRQRDCEAKLATLQDQIARRDQLKQLVAAITVRPADVTALDRLEAQAAALATRSQASATTLAIAYAQRPTARIAVGGREVAVDAMFDIGAPVTVDLPGIGTLTVTPGSDARQAACELDACRASLADHLQRLGVETVDAARVACDEGRRQDSDLASLVATLGPTPERAVATLQTEIDERARQLILDIDDGGDDLPALADAVLHADQRERAAEAAEVAWETAQAAVSSAERSLDQMRGAATSRQARRDDLASRLPPVEERAAVAESHAREVEEAQRQLDVATLARVAIARDVPDDGGLVVLAREGEVAKQRLEAARADLERAAQSVSELQGWLASYADEGIEAVIDDLSEQLDSAEVRASDLRDEADALLLLSDALSHAESRRTEALLAPVVARLGPLVDQVIPGLRVDLAGLTDANSVVRAERREPHARLSDGTREQIAVLVRLAYARLLADQGCPVPVVLDDALVFSDDTRLAAIAGVLADAAGHHQVLLLTCHEQAFAPLVSKHGANTVALVSWDPARGERAGLMLADGASS